MSDESESLTRPDVCMLIAQSQIMQQWHWFRYHFSMLHAAGWEHPLAAAVIDALVDCDKAMPGYAESFITRLAAVGGKEKFLPHYEQLIQQLAELHVVRQVVSFDWPGGAHFVVEPTPKGSKKNPEITVEHDGSVYGIEVKAPALIEHINARGRNTTQVPARVFSADTLDELKHPDETLTLPRDNPVKDFLISADAKFRPFKEEVKDFIGVLVIVWDDHVYEPISSLLHEASGLFTSKSFHKDGTGRPVTYAHVDGVFLVRHLHQLISATRDEMLIDGCKHPLDYGADGEYPFKVFVQNPNGTAVPVIIQRCLQGLLPSAEMGAEYMPKDLVWWFPIAGSE